MIDFGKIKTYPIKNRKNKVSIRDFFRPDNNISLPPGDDLRILAEKIMEARRNNKEVVFMMGGHVIKVGCSPLLIDLMKRNIITHIAVNGSFSIHDFEIALIGETSEDVATNLEDGTFGMVEETGRMMNEAISEGAKNDKGFGHAIGKLIWDNNLEFKEESVLYHACKLNIPLTVHTCIGAEIIYQHPACNGAAMGKTSYDDFKIFANTLSNLEDGVIINIGSAVIMPEVFLKALTIVRNLGFPVKKFTSANLDMIKHYRPTVNVVQRPTSLGGLGLQIMGKHEENIPLLHKLLT